MGGVAGVAGGQGKWPLLWPSEKDSSGASLSLLSASC